jgi:hypothetical protein
MLFNGFIGPTYQSSSLNADAEDCLNWYPELVESGAGKNKFVYYRTPGLNLFTTLPHSPVRGVLAGENRLFAVGGSHFYEVMQDGSTVDQGDIGNDGNPVDIVANGAQILLASNGWVWLDTGASVAAVHFINPWTDLVISGSNSHIVSSVLLPFTAGDVGDGIDITGGTGFTVGFLTVLSVDGSGNATLSGSAGTVSSTGGQAAQRVPGVRVSYLDGYFWAQKGFNSNKFYLSYVLNVDLNGGSSWDPTQFATKEGYPDNLAGILADHEEMWLFGDLESSEVWRNNGQVQPNFPYQRDPGAFIHYACTAPFSPLRVNNGVGWLARDVRRGGIMAVYAQGYQPVRISTHAVEQAWGSYTKVSDAISYGEIFNGHHFWNISFPTANATWSYDFTSQMWHRRGYWNGTSVDRSRVAFQGYVGLGTLSPAFYGGDWSTGAIYTVGVNPTNYLTDNLSGTGNSGTLIHRIRTSPYLFNEDLRLFDTRFFLAMQGAPGLIAILDWSDDGAKTWSNQHPAGWQARSNERAGIPWRRIGHSWNRIYRVTIAAAVDVALFNAYLGEIAGAD